MKFKRIIRINLFCAALALCLAGAWLGAPRPVAGREAQPITLHGAAALERLQQDGQYESLQAALNFTLQQKPAAADGAAQDLFGAAVALSGETLVVGAPYDDATPSDQDSDRGAVSVFVRNGTVWTEQAKLSAADGTALAYFGWSVALDGNTLAVGAANDSIIANNGQGSVYVFTRSGTTQPVWTQSQKLTASDGAGGDNFGNAVALSNDMLAVGAISDDVGANADQGSVYVFRRNNAGWTQHHKLSVSDGAANDKFGAAVALAGNTLAAGAPYGDDTQPDQGTAYVFQRSGQTWTQQGKLTAGDGAAHDLFGWSVALYDSVLAVGAPNDGSGPVSNEGQGSVYTFTRVGSSWAQSQKLAASDGAMGDFFGGALALNYDTLVIGARRDAIDANPIQGSVYVFSGPGFWQLQQKLTASDGAASDFFGNAVALSGGTVVAGAPGDDLGTNANQGSVYVFTTNSPCPAISIAPASLPGGASGTAYSQQFTASGGTAPYSFSVSGGALPPGLTLTSNGLLSGTPATEGAYQFTIRASGSSMSGLCFGSRAYTLTIAPPCSTFTFDPPTLPNGMIGEPYSETLTVTGGAEPYSFSTKGSVPPGLRLSVDGVLSGTPVARTGRFSFTAIARDANGCVGSKSYTITITPPVIESSAASRPEQPPVKH